MTDRLMVDFDNTLTEADVAYWEGERETLAERVGEYVRQHYHDGGTVIVWTARPWSEASTIAARLTEWEIPYHGIRCEKGSADVYLDDKALRPGDIQL